MRASRRHSHQHRPSGAAPRRGSTLNRDRERVIRDFEKTLAINSPEYCAQTIVRGVERNAARLLVGGDARLLDLFVRWLPQRYQWVLAAGLRRRWSRSLAEKGDAPSA